MSNATTFLQDVITDEPHLCTFLAVGLNSCASYPFRHFHIEVPFIMADLFFLLEVTIFLGYIYYPLSITLCSHFSFSFIQNHIDAFFFLVLLSLVSPIVATFNTSLKMLRIVLTY